jgi:hypothetical protein
MLPRCSSCEEPMELVTVVYEHGIQQEYLCRNEECNA